MLDDFSYLWFPLIGFFLGLGVVLLFYSLWLSMFKIEVEGSTFTVYKLFRAPQTFSFSEVTNARQSPYSSYNYDYDFGYTIYVRGKKVCAIEGGYGPGYFTFIGTLEKLNLINAPPPVFGQSQEALVIRKAKVGMVAGVLGRILAAVVTLLVVFSNNAEPFYTYAIFFLFFLYFLGGTIYTLRWKIVAAPDVLRVRKFIKTREYTYGEIEGVVLSRVRRSVMMQMGLCAGGKTFAKVEANCKNYFALQKLLQTRGIPIL